MIAPLLFAFALVHNSPMDPPASVAADIEAQAPKSIGISYVYVNIFNTTDERFVCRTRMTLATNGPFVVRSIEPDSLLWNKFVRFYRPSKEKSPSFTVDIEWDEQFNGSGRTFHKTLQARCISPEEEHKIVEVDKLPIPSIGVTYYVEKKDGHFVLTP